MQADDIRSSAELFERFPLFQIAGRENSAELSRFFRSTSMRLGTWELFCDRGDDLFQANAEEAEDSVVILFKNEDGSIGGTATLHLRWVLVNGSRTKAVYLADLRTSSRLSRRTRLDWRKIYFELLNRFRDFSELQGAEFFYSAILDENLLATRALTGKREGIHYHGIGGYQTLLLLSPGYNGSSVQSYSPEVLRLLHSVASRKKMAPSYGDELLRALRAWPEFSLSSFRSIQEDGKLLGCMAPWSESRRRWIARSEHPAIQPFLRRDGSLDLTYLTFFALEPSLPAPKAAQVALQLIRSLERGKLLSLTLGEQDAHLARALQQEGLVVSQVPGKLYEVNASSEGRSWLGNGVLFEGACS
jgi:hypothetical protein